MSSKLIYVTVGLDEETAKRLDLECKEEGRSRSALVRQIFRQRYKTVLELAKEGKHAD